MFKGSLFNMRIVEKNEHGILFEVSFDPSHEVFKGHFPQRPVVPGVLLMQTVRECFEDSAGIGGKMITAGDLKFTNPVVPGGQLMIHVQFTLDSEGVYKIKSRGFNGDTAYFKINFELK